jgi:transposase-like protein
MKFSEEEKALWLEDWRQSGKNAWAYAKENGIPPQTFARWTKTKTESKSCFVEVPSKEISAESRQELLIEKGEITIHIPLTIGSGELRTIITVLAGVV